MATPEIIVSGWFLFGLGLLSATKFTPDRAVMSSKRMVLLWSASAAIALVAARVTAAATVRSGRSMAENDLSKANSNEFDCYRLSIRRSEEHTSELQSQSN